MNELIKVESINAIDIFTGDQLDPLLKSITEKVRSFEPDLSTVTSRKEIASLARKVSTSKTYLIGEGEKLIENQKKAVKLVTTEIKKMKDSLDALRDEARKPLTDWENTEKERVEKHQCKIQDIKDRKDMVLHSELNSGEIKTLIDSLEKTKIDEFWEEYANQAAIAKDDVLSFLRVKYESILKHEQDQAELEKLKKEQAERDEREAKEKVDREQKEREEKLKKEAAEKARVEAEEKAKLEADKKEEERLVVIKEKEDAERKVKEAEKRAKDAEAKAERERAESEIRAKQERDTAIRLERERIENAERERKLAEEKRKEDVEHRAKINNAICDVLIASSGISLEQAKAVVTAIASNKVPNTKITY